jgi:hypothetical protein
MFVQFIEGPVADREALRRQLDRWLEELAPGAEGWLGLTGGIAPDGTGFFAARFASAAAARANSDRPEQGRWWEETRSCFAGEVTFIDCDRAETFLGGGSDDAGFVQILRGRVTSPEDARALLEAFEEELPELRPDVLGGYIGIADDGAFTQVVYFTSEEEARAAEQRTSPEREELQERVGTVMAEEVHYLDLPDPWLASP